jgi:hypothetical protein
VKPFDIESEGFAPRKNSWKQIEHIWGVFFKTKANWNFSSIQSI